MLTIIPRPFGGFNLYEKGKLISVVRPYMNSWTFTYKGSEERFIVNVYPEYNESDEFKHFNTANKCIEHIQKLLFEEREAKERSLRFRKMLFGD